MAEVTDDEYLSSSVSSWDESKEYNVQEVIAEKQVDGQTLYLVKWEDYSELYNTWEPKESFIASLSLELWESRKELERNGLEKPFDVEKWEKRKRDYHEKKKREKKKKQSKYIRKTTKTITTPQNVRARRVRKVDTRLPSSSEDESYSSSEDSISSTKSAEVRQRGNASSSHKESRHSDSVRKNLHRQDDVQSPAQIEMQPPVKAANNRQRPMSLAPNTSGNVSDTEGNRILRTDTSNKFGGRPAGEDAIQKRTDSTKPKFVSDSKRKTMATAVVDTDEPSQDSRQYPSSTKQFSFQPTPRPSILGDNWNKSKKKAKNTEKAVNQDAVPYKTMAAQRRAEKRGRNEPEPDIEQLDFMNLNKGSSIILSKPQSKPKQVSLKETVGSDSTIKGDLLLLGAVVRKSQAAENQPLVDDECNREVAVRERPPIAPLSTNQIPYFPRVDTRSDAEIDVSSHIPSSPSLAPPIPILHSGSSLARRSRDTANAGSKASIRTSSVTNDRGVATNETYYLPDPLPFKTLYGDIKPQTHLNFIHNPVYGYLKVDSLSISVEFACATSGLRRLLLEEKNRSKGAVIFPCTHSITSEEYQEILHRPESIYFGAGQIKNNVGKSSDISTQHTKYDLILVASKLRGLRSAAIFSGTMFSLVIWPSGDPSWRFLDDLFTSDSKSTSLRFLARKPISVHACYSKTGIIEESRPQFGELGHSTSQLHVFLLYHQRYRREHDLVYAVAKRMSLTIWSSLEPGHWVQFCARVAGPPGRAKLSHQQKGVVIAHVSFSQYGHLPRLFRLISRGTRIFTIDTMQKNAKGQLLRGEYLTQVEVTRQGRDRKQVKLLGSKANLQNCSVDLLYSVPPKMIAVEIFPIDRGYAILLLDSVMIQNPGIACKVLQWFKFRGAKKRHRLVVRPKLHQWIYRVAHELRSLGTDTRLVSVWEELRDLATDLITPDRETNEESDRQEDDYPPIICLPSLNGFNEYCTHTAYSDSPGLIRDQDRKLFDLFAVWTVEEIRVFRRFQVLTAERDSKEFNEIFSSWTEKWRYIAMLTGEEFLSTLDAQPL